MRIISRLHGERRRARQGALIVPLVELSSDLVTLRPYRDEDAALLFAAAIESIESVGRWMPWCHPDYAESDSITWVKKAQESWRSGDEYGFALFDRAGRFAGGAGLNQFNRDHKLANLGYWVRQSRQGHGIAVSAVRCLARFGLATTRNHNSQVNRPTAHSQCSLAKRFAQSGMRMACAGQVFAAGSERNGCAGFID